MRDWLERNPNGLKDAFETYFKTLPADVKKVSNLINFTLLLALNVFVCRHTRSVPLQQYASYSREPNVLTTKNSRKQREWGRRKPRKGTAEGKGIGAGNGSGKATISCTV